MRRWMVLGWIWAVLWAVQACSLDERAECAPASEDAMSDTAQDAVEPDSPPTDVPADLRSDLAEPDLPPVEDSFQEVTPPDADVTLPPSPPLLLLNELNCHGDDFIEILNASPEAAADLADYVLTDGEGDSHRLLLPAGTLLGPGERLTLYEAPAPNGFPFGLSCGQDVVRLLNPDGVEVGGVALPLTMEGYTWSRLPDGEALWGFGKPTPQQPNQEAPNLDETLFDPFVVHTINIGLAQESVDALWVDSATYVPGTFQMEGSPATAIPLGVGVRLKGKYGSFQTLDGKSALKIKFNYEDKSRRFQGLKKLTLNNMVQDPSMIHEVLAYKLFEAMGVPSPRTGYAWVTINGEPYGLYLVLESYDDVAMSRHFASTQHVYEGEYGNDVIPAAVAYFDVDEGEVGAMEDLTLLANASFQAGTDSWMEEVSPYSDVEEWLRMWAVEIYIGHWDGYAPTINNYYLHSDDQGVFSFLPNGTDQTFSSFLGYHDGGGYLFQRSMQDPECRQRYDQVLVELLDLVKTMPLDNLAQQVWEAISAFVEADPRKPYSFDDALGAMVGARSFMVSRSVDLMQVSTCWADPLADLDGDGFRCEQDCNEGDPATHVGAYDTCGDMVDQDCNGLADDSYECPDCHEMWRGPHLYYICLNSRTYADARAHCQELGADLVVVNSPEESAWLTWALPQWGLTESWMGITDEAQEGVWLDYGGTPIDFFGWGEGQPDNWGDSEHCAEFFAWNTWNDISCYDVNPVACEMACTPGQDEDHDGAPRCGGDCDDSNPDVSPSHPEVCNDGIDNDCDMEVDSDC